LWHNKELVAELPIACVYAYTGVSEVDGVGFQIHL
jgi:hypothetical protein